MKQGFRHIATGITVACATLAFVHLGAVQPVSANEGRIAVQNGAVACEGISVWESDRYHIMGRCQGLTYPFAERLDRYMLWVQPVDGDPVRVEEVERGLFDAQTDVRFSSIMITAEEDNNPRQPSGTTIVSGNIQPYSSSSGSQVAPAQPTPTPEAAVVSPTPTASRIQGINFKSNSVINIALIIVLVAVVLWILFFMRR